MMRVILLTVLLIISQGVMSMSILNAGRVCVFSAVKAQLTQNGEPLKNAKVIRRWNWNSENEEAATTDENGYFEFPAVFERSIARFLPIELVVAQGLFVVVNGEEQPFWSNSKREPEENAEYGGRPFNVTCELNDEEELIKDFGSLMLTMCKMEK